MRLRNIKGAQDIIAKSKYIVLEPNKYKGNFKQLFNNSNPIEIEIGMGKGDFIIERAKQNPNINYIGVEKYASVLVYATKKLEDTDLPNLKIINIDANTIDEIFSKEISKVYLNFSDPWPKKKHSNRRLTSFIFLNKYKNIFVNECYIEMKTDNQNLFEYSIISLSEFGYVLKYVTFDLYNDDLTGNIQTEYEKKFVSKGMKIHKLVAIQKVDY
mgnify:CR=1 FL=1